MIGLGRIGNRAYGGSQYTGFTTNFFRECSLVSRPNRYFYSGEIASRRTVKQIYAKRLEHFSQRNRVLYRPAADHPIRGGDSYPEWIFLRPDLAHCGHHFTHNPRTVGERASILVNPVVGER